MPVVHPGASGVHRKAELLARRAGGHLAGGPVDGSDAVPLHVPTEVGPELRTGRVVDPLRLEGLGAELADPGESLTTLQTTAGAAAMCTVTDPRMC